MPSKSRLQKRIVGKQLESCGKQDRGAPPVFISWVPRPRSAHLEDGTLSWEWHAQAVIHGVEPLNPPVKARRVSDRLGERFAALADKPDKAICSFAAEWGPLRYPGAPTTRGATQNQLKSGGDLRS
jgi:hypothetical protein